MNMMTAHIVANTDNVLMGALTDDEFAAQVKSRIQMAIDQDQNNTGMQVCEVVKGDNINSFLGLKREDDSHGFHIAFAMQAEGFDDLTQRLGSFLSYHRDIGIMAMFTSFIVMDQTGYDRLLEKTRNTTLKLVA